MGGNPPTAPPGGEAPAQNAPPETLRLHISVTDTGIGISSAKQSAIFAPFEQADNSMARRYGGTGLGLTISARLVEMMGGRIWVESEVGRGSTFHFSVPVGLQPGAGPLLELPEAVRLEGVPVLVVDDNATAQTILAAMLAQWGMRATPVADLAAALEELRRATRAGQPFPLVFLDSSLPEGSVTTLAGLIKRQAQEGVAVILMLSAGDRPLESGSCYHLTKPLKQSDVLDTVQLALAASPGSMQVEAAGRQPSGEPAPEGWRPAASTEAGGRQPSGQPQPEGWRPPASASGQADAGETVREGNGQPSQRPLRILLAEDNPINQKVAVGVLRLGGHQVVVANTGKEAVAAVGLGTFDLVLMDVQMPEMNGLEATAAIRRSEAGTGRHVPIIALTAHAMKGDRERFLSAGMDAYVAKPLRREELWEAIGACVPLLAGTQGETHPDERDEQTLNRATLLDRVGGDVKLLKEILFLFRGECPRLMEELHQAVAVRDTERVRQAAHTLKGTLGSLSASNACTAALRLEELGVGGDLSQVDEAFASLRHRVGLLNQALARFDGDLKP